MTDWSFPTYLPVPLIHNSGNLYLLPPHGCVFFGLADTSTVSIQHAFLPHSPRTLCRSISFCGLCFTLLSIIYSLQHTVIWKTEEKQIFNPTINSVANLKHHSETLCSVLRHNGNTYTYTYYYQLSWCTLLSLMKVNSIYSIVGSSCKIQQTFLLQKHYRITDHFL